MGSAPRSRRRIGPAGAERGISKISLQVEAGIQAGDLLGISVEGQRRAALHEEPAFADAALGLLAPARMIHLRIHVGIEAVFARVLDVPGARRLLLDQTDPDDRLDSLEPVFPRND